MRVWSFKTVVFQPGVRSCFFASLRNFGPHLVGLRVRHGQQQAQLLCAHGLKLSPPAYANAETSNKEVEVACWVIEEASCCVNRRVSAWCVFPENLGGDRDTGPASVWHWKEVPHLQRFSDVVRGSA